MGGIYSKRRYLANKALPCLELEYSEYGTLTLPTRKGANPQKLSDIPTDDLFDYCVQNKVGYGYYQEERRRRDLVSFDIHENSNGKMNLFLSSLCVSLSKPVVLIGESGIGKTTWAINNSDKPALIVSHIDQLKQFRASYHKTIIFDDMSFLQWPVQAQIHITDQEQPRAIHVRYGTVSIPAFTKKIFTSNERPFSIHPAIDRRINLFHC